MIFFLSRRPGMSSQHGWLGAMGWAMHWNTVDTLLDQTSAQLGQWSQNYINYNITFTKQVFILLASLTLCFSPLSCVYTVALHIQKQVGQRRWIYNEKKNQGLHHPWVNPPLNQWHCLGQALWWLKGSTWPWQASVATLNTPVCLPPFLLLRGTSSAGVCCSLQFLTEKDCPMSSSQQCNLWWWWGFAKQSLRNSKMLLWISWTCKRGNIEAMHRLERKTDAF